MPPATDAAHKRELRHDLKAARAALPVTLRRDAEVQVAASIGELLAGATFVGIYLAVRDELSVDAVFAELRSRGVRVAVPRVPDAPDVIEMVVTDALPVRPGRFGIREPSDGDVIGPRTLDAVLVPGLGFAPDGGRLGYGGGYYDRFLATLRDDALRIGVCYECQVRTELPMQEHDVRMTHLITEARIVAVDGARAGARTWKSSSE